MTTPDAAFGREYFERAYRDYDRQNPPRKLRFYAGLVQRAARVAHPRVLDVGCAFGNFLATLDPAWERCGVDVSPYAIERARERVPGAALAVSSATVIPLAGPFDVITAFDVVEHVPSLEAVMAAVRSRLAPGGCFILVVPVYDGITGPVIRLLDRDATHIHQRSRRFWLDWLRAHAFVIEAWWGIYRYLLAGRSYLHYPTRWLRWCTPAVAIVARHDGRAVVSA